MHGIAPLTEIESLTVSSVGKLGQTLGSLAQRKAGVAPSFVVTSSALKEFVILSGIRDRVFSLLKQKRTDQLHDVLLNQEVPDDLEEDLFSHCSALHSNQFIAHSSSSFADHSYSHPASSKHKVLEAIKHCWASVVTPERINSLTKNNLFSAVIVQPAPTDAKKGRIYTVNPFTNSAEKMVIELFEPRYHVLLVNKGNKRVVNEDDFFTIKSPLYIEEKDTLASLAGQVNALFRKAQAVDWVKLDSGFAISRIQDLSNPEKQAFFERVKKSGFDIGK